MVWDWEFGLLMFTLGIGVGFLLTWRIAPRGDRVRELEQELATARAELAAYRDKVNQHFQTSATLFEDMTEHYRAVYQHMASSAQTLCAEQPPALQLDLNESAHPMNTPITPRTPQATEEAKPAPAAATVFDSSVDDEDTYLGDAPHIPELTEEVAAPAGVSTDKTPPMAAH